MYCLPFRRLQRKRGVRGFPRNTGGETTRNRKGSVGLPRCIRQCHQHTR